MRRSAVAALVLCGCYHPSAATGVPCAANGECPSGQMCDMQHSPPICVATPATDASPVDTSIDAALACTDSSTCPTADPICDQATHTCRGCTADAECTGGVCIEATGECIPDAAVLYLTPGGLDLGACTRVMPCGTFAYAFSQLSSAIYVVRVGDGNYTEAVHLASNAGAVQVVVSGEHRDPSGAVVTASTAPVMLFDSSTNALLEGVSVMNSTGDGIQARSTLAVSRIAATNNAGAGINQNVQTTGGGLRVSDSNLSNNTQQGVISGKGYVDLERDVVIGNQGGGVRTSQGPITIVNCIVARNGSASSNVGGLRLDNLTVAGSMIEFDTIAYNTIASGATASPGLQSGNTITVTNLILADNGASGTAQMSSNVSVTHSLFEGGPQPQGMGNKTGSPAFKDVTGGDFHITAASVAIDIAGASTVGVDVDGETRPYGPGPDMGADEYHP